MSDTFTYAGFRYDVTGVGEDVVMTPQPGQHQAAAKSRNVMNARDMYVELQGREEYIHAVRRFARDRNELPIPTYDKLRRVWDGWNTGRRRRELTAIRRQQQEQLENVDD